MIHYLAAAAPPGGFSVLFHTIGHYVGDFFRLGLPWVWGIGLAIHFLIIRRLGIPLNHYITAFILGMVFMIAFPAVSKQTATWGTTARSWVDGAILILIFSDVVLQVLGRFGGRRTEEN